MKKKYYTPLCESHIVDLLSLLALSSNGQGLTEENPAPLKRLFPIFVKYDELEPDIKENLKSSDYAINYRTLEMMGIEYQFIVCTYKGKEECICFYCELLHYTGYLMYYNIYDILETFLMQIRKKVNGVYQYNITPEVRKKLPTFCKLMSNAAANEKNPTYGLPMIAFLDAEQKYTLLSACFKYGENIDENTFNKIHESFFKILTKLTNEVIEADVLSGTYKALVKNGLKTLLIARHFFNLP